MVGPALLSIVSGPSWAQEGTCFGLLDCETVGTERVVLKLVLLNAGRRLATDGEAELAFVKPGEPGATYEAPEPGPRTVRKAMHAAGWSGDSVEVVSFGPFTIGADTPRELEVRGGLVGDPPAALGTLVREEGDPAGPVRLRRACPAAGPEDTPIVAVAACELLGANRVVVRVAYLNCGASLRTDYSAFLHFEPEATGENLAVTSEMGLYPSSRPTDSAAWGEDEVTVVTFGPYTLPAGLDRPLYLRVGLYDQAGTGERLRPAGSDERDRVLVGRLVPRDGGVVFERTPPAAEEGVR